MFGPPLVLACVTLASRLWSAKSVFACSNIFLALAAFDFVVTTHSSKGHNLIRGFSTDAALQTFIWLGNVGLVSVVISMLVENELDKRKRSKRKPVASGKLWLGIPKLPKARWWHIGLVALMMSLLIFHWCLVLGKIGSYP
jgi:hypothetical protein